MLLGKYFTCSNFLRCHRAQRSTLCIKSKDLYHLKEVLYLFICQSSLR